MLALQSMLNWHGDVRGLLLALGVPRKLSFTKHLVLDTMQALLLVAAPFLFVQGETVAQSTEVAVISLTVRHPEVRN